MLPPILKLFGFRCKDLQHPSQTRLVFSYEREWAWAIFSPYMAEVCENARLFIQPSPTIAFLERVSPGLRSVSIHPSERASPHSLWTLGSVLEFMLRASEVSQQHLRPWVIHQELQMLVIRLRYRSRRFPFVPVMWFGRPQKYSTTHECRLQELLGAVEEVPQFFYSVSCPSLACHGGPCSRESA